MLAFRTALVIAATAILLTSTHTADAASFTLTLPQQTIVDIGQVVTLTGGPTPPPDYMTYVWSFDSGIKKFVTIQKNQLVATIQDPGTYSFTLTATDKTNGQSASANSTIIVRDIGLCPADVSGSSYPCKPACDGGEVWIRPPQKCHIPASGSLGVCCAPDKPPGTTCSPGDECRQECTRPESLTENPIKVCNDGAGSVLCCSPSQYSIPGDVVSIGISTPKKAYRAGEKIDPRVTVRGFDSRVGIVRFKVAMVRPGTAAVDIPGVACTNNTTPNTVTFGANSSPSPGPYDNIRTSGGRCGEFAINKPDSQLPPGNYTFTATVTEISSGNGTAKDIKDPVTFNNTAGTLVTVAENNSVVPEMPLPFALAAAGGVLFTLRIAAGKKRDR